MVFTLVYLISLAGCGGSDNAGQNRTGVEIAAPGSFSIYVATGTVEGRLLYVRDGTPIAGATVTIGEMSGITAEDGTFSISDISLGLTTLEVDAPGYALFGSGIKTNVQGGVDYVADIIMRDDSDAPPPVVPHL